MINKASAVWPPFTQMKTAEAPINIVRAKDTLLFDAEGKTYIDANSSWWVNVHGHANRKIADAIYSQFQDLDHVLLAGVTHPKVEELATRICSILPSKFEKVFFSDDGSTAIEVALKMCFQYYYNQDKPRTKVLALDGAYHGDTFGAMSIGQRGYFNKPFEHFFFDVDFLDFPTEEKENEILKVAEEKLKTGEFAVVIVEPLVQGSAGMRMYSEIFLDKLVTLAKAHGTLVIFDEIMTGWGRTGKMFAMDHCENKPDIVCLSKGLTGGVLPMGLTVATNEIFEAFLHEEKTKALLHGHSYTGNALACAAACASMDIFKENETWEDVNRIVDKHADFVDQIKGHSAIFNLRQGGTILAIELNADKEKAYFGEIRDKAYKYFLDKGILLRPLGNVIFLNPPYCITDDELAYCHAEIKNFLELV